MAVCICPWKDGIAQGVRDGGVHMSMEGRADICSCNICTSTIHGGRIIQGARDGGTTDVFY